MAAEPTSLRNHDGAGIPRNRRRMRISDLRVKPSPSGRDVSEEGEAFLALNSQFNAAFAVARCSCE